MTNAVSAPDNGGLGLRQDADLRREVQHLRIRQARADERSAENLKHFALAGIVAVLFGWAVLSSVLEGLALSGAHWIVAGPLAILIILWWAAQRRHERLEKALADTMKEARAAGYSVELSGSWVHVAEAKGQNPG